MSRSEHATGIWRRSQRQRAATGLPQWRQDEQDAIRDLNVVPVSRDAAAVIREARNWGSDMTVTRAEAFATAVLAARNLPPAPENDKKPFPQHTLG